MKSHTAWTFSHMFEDGNYWDDSVKAEELVQQLVKKEEKTTSTSGTIEVSNEDLEEVSSAVMYAGNSKSPMIDEDAVETDDKEFIEEVGDLSDKSMEQRHP